MHLVGKLKALAFQLCKKDFCDIARTGDISSQIGRIFIKQTVWFSSD